MFFIQTLIEFAVAGFIIWGLFNESKLVDFEDKIAAKFKKNAPCSSGVAIGFFYFTGQSSTEYPSARNLSITLPKTSVLVFDTACKR